MSTPLSIIPFIVRPPEPTTESILPDDVFNPPSPPALEGRVSVVTPNTASLLTSPEDIKSFSKAVHFFLKNEVKNICPKKIGKYIEILIKFSDKLNNKYINQEEITVEAVAEVTNEMITKKGIQFAILKAYPQLAPVLVGSEFINIFRPRLEQALDGAMKALREQLFQTHQNNFTDQMKSGFCSSRRTPCDLFQIRDTDLMRLTRLYGCFLGKTALQIATYPDEVVNTAAHLADHAERGTPSFISRWFGAMGTQCQTWVEGVAKLAVFESRHNSCTSVNDTISDLRSNPRALLDAARQYRAPKSNLLGYETESPAPLARQPEFGVNWETLNATDQPFETSSSALDLVTKTTPGALPSTFRPVEFPLSDLRHPLGKFVSERLTLSANRHYVQVKITLTDAPTVAMPPSLKNSYSGEPNMGGLGVHPEDKEKIFQKTISHDRKKFEKAYDAYVKKKDELSKAIDSLSKDDNYQTHETKWQDILAKKEALKPLAEKAMETAYDLHKCASNNKQEGSLFHQLNHEIKSLLWDHFGVPKLEKLKREHLSQSNVIKCLNELDTSHISSMAQKKQQEMADHAAKILTAEENFRAQFKAVKDMEASNESIQEATFADAIAKCHQLGQALIKQVRARAAFTPGEVLEADINSLAHNIENNIRDLTLRGARYQKLLREAAEFSDEQEMFFDSFSINRDPKTNEERLLDLKQRKQALVGHIQELAHQCPTNSAQNSELVKLQQVIDARFVELSFCLKSLPDKLLEIDHLQKAEKANMCNQRYGILLLQLQQDGDPAKFLHYFNQFLHFLGKEKSFTEGSGKLIAAFTGYIIEGVDQGKIVPNEVLQQLKVALKQATLVQDATSIHLAIGELSLRSSEKFSQSVLSIYEQCQALQPDNPQWFRAIAYCHLETLHWASAEKALLDAFAKNPNDKNNLSAISALSLDKYKSASIALEWLQTLTATPELSFKQAQLLSHHQFYLRKFRQATHAIVQVTTHPAVINRWLPDFIALPESFKPSLITLLNEQPTHSRAYHLTTFATRTFSIASSIFWESVSSEEYPLAHKISTGVSFVTNMVQQTLVAGAGIYDNIEKYRMAKWALSDQLQAVVTASSCLSSVIAPIQALIYKDEQTKRLHQQTHPYVHTLIETLGSKHLSSTALYSGLLNRSSNLIARGIKRVSGRNVSGVETLVQYVTLGYFAYEAQGEIRRVYKKIMDSRE
jgi:hypothetical protein